jgi:hypothetical protein
VAKGKKKERDFFKQHHIIHSEDRGKKNGWRSTKYITVTKQGIDVRCRPFKNYRSSD